MFTRGSKPSKKTQWIETFFKHCRNQGHEQCFMAVNEPFVEKRFWLEHGGHLRVAVLFFAWLGVTLHPDPTPRGSG